MEMEDKIIQKLLDLEGQMKSLATKDDVRESEHRIMQILDNQAAVLKRLDQERFFTSEHIRRIEDDVLMLKKHLHLA